MSSRFGASAFAPACGCAHHAAPATLVAVQKLELPLDLSEPRIRLLPINVLALALAARESRDGADTLQTRDANVRVEKKLGVAAASGLLAASAAAALVWPSTALASCGSAFCTMNTDWNVQGIFAEPGARAELRYEYINQDQLRAGSTKVSPGEIPSEHDELSTRNQSLFGTFDYNFGSGWGMSAIVPVVKRDHSHIDNDSGELEQWNFTSLGDIRVAGRYQFPLESQHSAHAHLAGFLAGLKLPTGKTDETNANGEVAERSLQPGTGTTDAFVGAYYQALLPQSRLSWFAQAAYAFALNSHDGYRPGYRTTLDVGGRYDLSSTVSLLLQLNALWRGRDSGDQAEPDDSGGRYLFLSPGISVMVARNVQLFAIVQLPLYQYVNGVQLTANWGATAGIGVRF